MSTTPGLAKPPAGAPAAAVAGIILALAVIAVGAVALHDTLQTSNVIGGPSWLGWVADKAVLLTPADWMTSAGAGAILAGLLLVIAALKPRKATHWAVGSEGVWIRRGDVARLAAQTARDVDAVMSAAGTVKRRTVRIAAISTNSDSSRVGSDLEAAVTRRLETINPAPRVRTRVTVEEN